MHPNNLLHRRGIRASFAATAALALGITVSACGSSDSSSSDSTGGAVSGSVNLVAYSSPQSAYEDTIEPGFNDTSEGADVDFSNSFGASGDQSRAVEAGQPADVVHFAIEPDIARLVDAGIVADGWADNQYDGILQDSTVVFIVRKGNPNNIQTWDDVASGDNEVVVPNPFTSGGARWDIMAAYGAAIEDGKTPDEALQQVEDILTATVQQDASASDALETFTSGKGDVLLAYESDALRAQAAGEDVDYVTPDPTILIETPGAVTADSQNPDAAQAFLDYLWSPDGQQAFADAGFRPVDPQVLKENSDKYPVPKNLFTIEDLGGWDKVTTEFFDPENGSVAQIEQGLGVTTG